MRQAVLAIAWLTLALASRASEIADAAERGDHSRVVSLISSGSDVDKPQIDGMNALHWAVHLDDPAMAKLLVKAGASVSAANKYGVQPISLACQNGNAEILKLLLDKGADPNAIEGGNQTALMTAARTGRVDCVQELVKRGAKVDAKERRGQTALMWAAAEGHTEVVEFLIEVGANFKSPLSSGFTPLLFAVRHGHTGVVLSLLKAGADVNGAADPANSRGRNMRSGTTPLMLAVENGHFELAVELLEAGADPNDQRSGFTALHALTWVRKSVRGDGIDGVPPPEGSGNLNSLDCARALVKHGAKINTPLKSGSGGRAKVHRKGATAFLMAAETADLAYLRLLIEFGADPTIPNVDNTVPIIAAAGLGVTAPGEEAGSVGDSIEAITYLLEIGADINAVDKNGETVMHAAAYKCEPKLIQFLDERGADIAIWNQKNKGGWTPLMIAQGFRPGNFRPIAEVEEAVSKVMLAHGVTPPPPPERKPKKNY